MILKMANNLTQKMVLRWGQNRIAFIAFLGLFLLGFFWQRNCGGCETIFNAMNAMTTQWTVIAFLGLFSLGFFCNAMERNFDGGQGNAKRNGISPTPLGGGIIALRCCGQFRCAPGPWGLRPVSSLVEGG